MLIPHIAEYVNALHGGNDMILVTKDSDVSELNITRSDAIDYLGKIGLFKVVALGDLSNNELKELIKTAVNTKGYNGDIINIED